MADSIVPMILESMILEHSLNAWNDVLIVEWF